MIDGRRSGESSRPRSAAIGRFAEVSSLEDERSDIPCQPTQSSLARVVVGRVDGVEEEFRSQPPSQDAIGEDLIPDDPGCPTRASGDPEAAPTGPRLVTTTDHPIDSSLRAIAENDHPFDRRQALELVDYGVHPV